MWALAKRGRRLELWLLALLGGVAAVGWAVTIARMRGMDAGPNTDPGSFGFFLGVWVVMMAAMMFPSAAPMVTVYARLQRSRAAAAIYQLTPWKERCLTRCRGPLGFVLTSWRDGHLGALRMGALHGAWCLGCCWALMASLFALGVMSLTWMAIVAAIIAVQKMLPWPRVATYGT